MIDLHDSHGKHIANFVNGQLYDTHGRNIGHFMEKEGIIVDMNGRYLGEIVAQRRLLYRNSSPYKAVAFGVYGNYGNIGNYGDYGNIGACLYGGYSDVNIR